MFSCKIFIWPCHLDLRRPFDLGSVWRITNLPTLSCLRLSVPELCVTQSDHLPSHGMVTAHPPCHVTYHRGGGKNDPHFWNPWTQFAYSLCHFQGARTKFKPCYMRKIAFIPLSRLQSSLRMRSITWPVHRGPPTTTRNNFLTPTCLFTIQLLWGYDND